MNVRPEVKEWAIKYAIDSLLPKLIDAGFDTLDVLKELELSDLDAIGVQKPGERKKVLMATKALQHLKTNSNYVPTSPPKATQVKPAAKPLEDEDTKPNSLPYPANSSSDPSHFPSASKLKYERYPAPQPTSEKNNVSNHFTQIRGHNTPVVNPSSARQVEKEPIKNTYAPQFVSAKEEKKKKKLTPGEWLKEKRKKKKA